MGSSQNRVPVTCNTCGKQFEKRADSLKGWAGRCKTCSNTSTARADRQQRAERARAQILRQGGIPNARKFTSAHIGGAKHWHWRGGVTPANQRERASAAMVRWRTAVYQRDHFTCQHCGQVGGKLNAHHVKPFSLYPALRYDIANGVTLCVKCHEQTPDYKGRAHSRKHNPR